MSQPPTARTTPAGSPAPRPPAINLEGIYTNIPILINRVRNNQLVASQIPPLRSLIANHARDIIIFHARLGRQNPILNLPDVLNPTIKVGNSEPITTETAFLNQIRAGVNAARNVQKDHALIASMNAKQQQAAAQRSNAAGTATPTGASTPTPQGGAAVAATGAAGAAVAQTAGRPPAVTTAASASTSQNASGAASPAADSPKPVAPPVRPTMTLQQVKDLVSLPQAERNAKLEADPGLKARFVTSYQFYHRSSAQRSAATPPPAAGTAGAAAGADTKPAIANTAQAPAAKPAPTQSSAPSSQTHVSSAPSSQPSAPRPASPPRAPPAPPPEPEHLRRKRKLREYAREQAPELELEYGLDDIFSQVLDTLVEGAAKDAIRLAAHRGSARVELKDMAFALDQFHDIVVPGFNAQVPKRVHVAEGEKKGKAVVPRVRRREEE